MALNVNGLVAFPPAEHPETDQRGREWPRLKAAEMAERVGLRNALHTYIDVTDNGKNLVDTLGLHTVPTHLLVDRKGKLVSVLRKKQFPDESTVDALVTNAGCIGSSDSHNPAQSHQSKSDGRSLLPNGGICPPAR